MKHTQKRDGLLKGFCVCFMHFSPEMCATRAGLYSLNSLENACVEKYSVSLKFIV